MDICREIHVEKKYVEDLLVQLHRRMTWHTTCDLEWIFGLIWILGVTKIRDVSRRPDMRQTSCRLQSFAFADNHVHRVLDDLWHNLFGHVISSSHSSDLFWYFQSCRSDRYTVLGVGRTGHTTIVCPSVAANKFRPAGPTRPAMYECSKTCFWRWGSEALRLSYDPCLFVSGFHKTAFRIEKRMPTGSVISNTSTPTAWLNV